MVALLTLAPGISAGVEPQRPGQQNFLARAVFGSGRLWLLADSGELSSIIPGQKVRVDAALPEPALDLCVARGQVMALTCAREHCKNWTFWTWREDRWSAAGVVPALSDKFVALSCDPDGETLVTDRHVVSVLGGKATTVTLSENLEPGTVASIHVTPVDVFAGINAGEWGGGLYRVDRKTGKVSIIEKNATGELCGGPLNPACDPVNGIVDEPWKPNCVAIAIGLIHFSPHGRIVEVCGDDVRRIYVKPFGSPRRGNQQRKDGEPFETVAFFGLARTRTQLLAAGIDGIYRFSGPGGPTITPLPKFQTVDGVGVSFDLPDIVLVLTAINRRRSISGNVPLLVPR